MIAPLTPYELIKALSTGMGEAIAGASFPNGCGETVPVNIFEQDLPISTAYDGEPEYAPFCLVRLVGGSITGVNEPENANILLIFCTYDENTNRQGYADTLHLMQLAKQYMLTNNVLAGCFVLQASSVQWTLEEDDIQGYHIGSITATYTCPATIRNEVDYD